MVIIKRDDYISFLNSTGVKMPTTPVTNEPSIQSAGNNNGNLATQNNNSPNSNISTIKRDNSQQQLQQLQQYTQQQNQSVINQNQTQQLAKAQLICRPNSHPFPVCNLI